MKYNCKFDISGRVLEIGEVKTFASGFTKREVVIETSPKDEYPNPQNLVLKKELTALADSLGVGDGVEATGFMEGRRWEGQNGVKYFLDLNCKSITVTDKAEKPTDAKSWEELLKLGTAYGVDKDALVARCKALGKAFKNFAVEDWRKLAAEIVAEAESDDFGNLTDNPDDLPF